MNWKTKKYLLYGEGIANNAVRRYMEKNGFSFEIFSDGKNEKVVLDSFDVIVKSPGIKPNSLLIQEAIVKKILIIGDLELYYVLESSTPIVCVTGSNGKTTTTTLVDLCLQDKHSYSLGGNIGIPLFNLLDKEKEGTLIEASSYMLDSTITFRPHIMVILNIEPHHLAYHQTFEQYFDAKTKCLYRMNANDIFIYNYDDVGLRNLTKNLECKCMSFSMKSSLADIFCDRKVIYYKNKEYLLVQDLYLKDVHNLYDFMAAILVSEYFQIDSKHTKTIITQFRGLPHRCEIIYTSPDLIVINDSKGTNPSATLRAFESIFTYKDEYQTFWIAGGEDTGEDFTILKPYLSIIKKVYLFGENKEKIKKSFENLNIDYQLFPSLDTLIDRLVEEILDKTIVLFSPASASKDMFSSFEERGNFFKNYILKQMKKQ